jgi:hypothetical protein
VEGGDHVSAVITGPDRSVWVFLLKGGDHSSPVIRPAMQAGQFESEMGKHPDLLVAHPTSTIFTTIGRNYEIS